MVRHIVLWRLKESANGRGKAENAAEIKRLLEDLNGKISGLLKLEVGYDFSRGAESSHACTISRSTISSRVRPPITRVTRYR